MSGSTVRPSASTAGRRCAEGYALTFPALVAQGIEHRPPEPVAQVRILPRARLGRRSAGSLATRRPRQPCRHGRGCRVEGRGSDGMAISARGSRTSPASAPTAAVCQRARIDFVRFGDVRLPAVLAGEQTATEAVGSLFGLDPASVEHNDGVELCRPGRHLARQGSVQRRQELHRRKGDGRGWYPVRRAAASRRDTPSAQAPNSHRHGAPGARRASGSVDAPRAGTEEQLEEIGPFGR